ncbi:MAG: LLM class flavin-dependent oxidoreductase, partial [Gammaproteobacteria bacterium]
MTQTNHPKIGYLLPTRERIMRGEPGTQFFFDMAERAESLGFDSLWVGDSLLAKPRHDPLTLLAAIAARTDRVNLGTAVLLPALRNPVILAHQVATLDQISEGRLILGVGIAGDWPRIKAEFAAAGVPFEKRVGRMMELLRLCKALWSGKPVSWDGRWKVVDGVLAPTPYRAGGPPIWNGSIVRAGLERTGRNFDGWFPTGPNVQTFKERWADLQAIVRAADRPDDAVAPAVYLTASIDNNEARANVSINSYLEDYY